MKATYAAVSSRPSHPTVRHWVRRLHLWIGAWGALAAIVYGLTGLVMNHRFGDNPWPQGDSIENDKVVLAVPAAARDSAEALSLWLRDSQGLDAQSIRKGAPRGGPEDAPEQWNLSGGNARDSRRSVPGRDSMPDAVPTDTTIARMCAPTNA